MGRIQQRLGQLAHAWELFTSRRENGPLGEYGGSRPMSSGARQDRVRMYVSNERSIIAAIYTRIAVDYSGVAMRHVRLDENGRFKETVKSGLNDCLTVEANLDQAASFFKIDECLSLFDQGTIAVVPIEMSMNPDESGGFDIFNMRVGRIVDWSADKVCCNTYDERTGIRRNVWVSKRWTPIVENPLYAVMNEPNSTLQRIIKKLNLLDVVDEQSASGKLDIIIQLPYTVRNETKQAAAEKRITDIEMQMRGSKYGIAYADATEKIVQLNRPAENNLMKQIEVLMELLYSQLGITKGIMDGTADEATMLNYYNRTIEPLLRAFAEEYRRKFLTKTARTRGQWVDYFQEPFKLVPMKDLAEIADKFTRNEIVTSNEFRGFLGLPPSSDPKADQLRNSNVPQPADLPATAPADGSPPADTSAQDAVLAQLEAELDKIMADLGDEANGLQ